jgi:hypothetical protein
MQPNSPSCKVEEQATMSSYMFAANHYMIHTYAVYIEGHKKAG